MFLLQLFGKKKKLFPVALNVETMHLNSLSAKGYKWISIYASVRQSTVLVDLRSLAHPAAFQPRTECLIGTANRKRQGKKHMKEQKEKNALKDLMSTSQMDSGPAGMETIALQPFPPLLRQWLPGSRLCASSYFWAFFSSAKANRISMLSSVVVIKDATETASASAVRTTFVGSIIPACTAENKQAPHNKSGKLKMNLSTWSRAHLSTPQSYRHIGQSAHWSPLTGPSPGIMFSNQNNPSECFRWCFSWTFNPVRQSFEVGESDLVICPLSKSVQLLRLLLQHSWECGSAPSISRRSKRGC